jgi:hypothetical protein
VPITTASNPEKARPIGHTAGGDSTGAIVLDTRTGERGDYAGWVACFAHVWEAPRDRLGRLLDLLSPNVTLIAPTTPARSTGHAAGRRAFERTFAAIPDLRAEVVRWSASGEALFIEMVYSATLGKRATQWHGVDRILFAHGEAIERRAYFNPAKVRSALVRSPTGWRQLLRLRTGL